MADPSIRVAAKAAVVRNDAVLRVEHWCPGDASRFSFPGGRGLPGDALAGAVQRKVHEETGALVDVGRILLAAEYVTREWGGAFGPGPMLHVLFEGALRARQEPAMPARHDAGPFAGHWVPGDGLANEPLRPAVASLRAEALPIHDPIEGLQQTWRAAVST